MTAILVCVSRLVRGLLFLLQGPSFVEWIPILGCHPGDRVDPSFSILLFPVMWSLFLSPELVLRSSLETFLGIGIHFVNVPGQCPGSFFLKKKNEGTEERYKLYSRCHYRVHERRD